MFTPCCLTAQDGHAGLLDDHCDREPHRNEYGHFGCIPCSTLHIQSAWHTLHTGTKEEDAGQRYEVLMA